MEERHDSHVTVMEKADEVLLHDVEHVRHCLSRCQQIVAQLEVETMRIGQDQVLRV